MVIPMVPPAQVESQVVAPFTEFQTMRGLATKGDIHAMAKVGAMYFNGEGIPENKSLALVWFRKAAEGGEPFAQAVVGLIFAEGELVPQSLPRAYQWLLKAVLGGDMQIIPTLWKVRNSLTPEEVAEANRNVLADLTR